MMRKSIRWIAALLLAVFLPSASLAAEGAHTYRFGPEDEHRVAITVDDVFNIQLLSDILDLCDQYQVKITVFPVGKRVKEADGDVWRRVVDSGHEIGSHTNNHRSLIKLNGYQIRSEMSGMQKRLNAALGYEYPLHIMRPPYGVLGANRGASKAGRELFKLGYPSLILWSVSNTDAQEALKQAKNGSIFLYHTNNKDYRCLQTLIPALLAQGYELVTVSDLLHLDENGNATAKTPGEAGEEASLPLEQDAEPEEAGEAEATAESPTPTPAPTATAVFTASPRHTPSATPVLTSTPTKGETLGT